MSSLRPARTALVLLVLGIACGLHPRAHGQRLLIQQIRSHNASMTELQPSWMGPLIQSDARLAQAIRLSVAEAAVGGGRTAIYGNNHGVSVVVARRFQFDFDPPSYFWNSATGSPSGFGNAGAQVKLRIASGNAQHGNFAVSAIDFHGFAPRSRQNGMLSAFDAPKLAAGVARGRFDLQSTLGGLLPAARVAAQGRAIEWNVTAQIHPTPHAWFDIENNAAFNIGGPNDGKIQNFITPAGYYMVRRGHWEPTHSVVVFNGGMQIATSSFHFYNHNLIAEMRILF